MDIVHQMCKLVSDSNKLWEKTPDPIKPVATGVAILIGLMLHKIVVAAGVVVFFGGRTVHKMGIDQQVLDEDSDEGSSPS